MWWNRRQDSAPRPSPVPTPESTALKLEKLADDIRKASAEVTAVAKILREDRE